MMDFDIDSESINFAVGATNNQSIQILKHRLGQLETEITLLSQNINTIQENIGIITNILETHSDTMDIIATALQKP